jgi:hypothetical protein
MLYYGLIEKLSKVSIFLTSGSRVDGSMRYGKVAQSRTSVPGVGDKGVCCEHE